MALVPVLQGDVAVRIEIDDDRLVGSKSDPIDGSHSHTGNANRIASFEVRNVGKYS